MSQVHGRPGGKPRPIDDGRFSGHNKSCFSEETIYTSSPDFVAAACKECIRLLTLQESADGPLPPWAEPRFGTEDMKAAYRQLPNCEADKPALLVAYWDQDAADVRYALLLAHPLGLSAAVLNFNRVPAS